MPPLTYPLAPLEMSLSTETLQMLSDTGRTVQDVLDGKVLGLDADEIVATAMSETGSHNGRGRRSSDVGVLARCPHP
jgi:hypothetical protein